MALLTPLAGATDAAGSFSLAALNAAAAFPFCCLATLGTPLVSEAVPRWPALLLLLLLITDGVTFDGVGAPDKLGAIVVLAVDNDEFDDWEDSIDDDEVEGDILDILDPLTL